VDVRKALPPRLRSLLATLALSLVGSVLGVALYLTPNDNILLAHRAADYALHIHLLDAAHHLGLRNAPSYETPDADLAFIAIDENSIGNTAAGLGPWPFPRSVWGRLLDRLARAGAKTVVFDIVFLEPSADPSQDAAFAAGMRRVPTVLGDTITTTTGGNLGMEPVAPTLAPYAARIGYTTIDTPGGFIMGQPPFIRTSGTGTFANRRFPSLATAAVETYTGTRLSEREIPTVDGRFVLLPVAANATQELSGRAGAEQFTLSIAGGGQLSLADALTMPIAQLRTFAAHRLIFVGPTAQALGDFVIGARGLIPGVFANARMADQLLRHIYVRAVPTWANLALIILLPLLASLAVFAMRPLAGMLSAALLGALFFEIDTALFAYRLLWVDLVHVMLALIVSAGLVTAFRVLQEGAQKRMVTTLFGMHVSPAVVREILKNDDPQASLALNGKRVKATIFYSDIRGFTAMSETMTPEEIYAQLNEYFDEMCGIIFKYGGYVDKFIGDCIMAVFSAPYQTPDDAKNAVLAALEQQRRIAELARRWEAQGKKVFTVGMGINTGDVVMGNLGARSRMNYTVIGDNVNVAARLYNVAKGGQIIISESTYEEVRDLVDVRELEPVQVKGKSAPLRIFEVVGLKARASEVPASAA